MQMVRRDERRGHSNHWNRMDYAGDRVIETVEINQAQVYSPMDRLNGYDPSPKISISQNCHLSKNMHC